MFLEPQRSPYDWNFVLFGFPIRVTWLFWVISAAWGYDWARGLDDAYVHLGLETPGMFALLAIWVIVTFLSILIHELGHSLAMRWYRQSSYIVLYHFGGLAIPDSYGNWRGSVRRPIDQIVISIAGPAFQFAFGVAVMLVTVQAGLSIGTVGFMFDGLLPFEQGVPASNAAVMGFIDAAVYTSIFWALLNLLPVLPLDGGRIAQSLLAMVFGGQATREATILSIVVAAGIALWAFQIQHSCLGVNFMILAIMNYQSLNDPYSFR